MGKILRGSILTKYYVWLTSKKEEKILWEGNFSTNYEGKSYCNSKWYNCYSLSFTTQCFLSFHFPCSHSHSTIPATAAAPFSSHSHFCCGLHPQLTLWHLHPTTRPPISPSVNNPCHFSAFLHPSGSSSNTSSSPFYRRLHRHCNPSKLPTIPIFIITAMQQTIALGRELMLQWQWWFHDNLGMEWSIHLQFIFVHLVWGHHMFDQGL